MIRAGLVGVGANASRAEAGTGSVGGAEVEGRAETATSGCHRRAASVGVNSGRWANVMTRAEHVALVELLLVAGGQVADGVTHDVAR